LARTTRGWSKRFEEPIVLDDGTTLRDAVQYLANVTVGSREKLSAFGKTTLGSLTDGLQDLSSMQLDLQLLD